MQVSCRYASNRSQQYHPPNHATQAYALCTPIGRCGMAWSERRVTGVQLPEQNEADTRTSDSAVRVDGMVKP